MKSRNLIVSIAAGSVALLFSVGLLRSAASAAPRSIQSLGERRASTGFDLSASELQIFSPDVPPEAVDDQAETSEDTPSDPIPVLDNDSDAEINIVLLVSFDDTSQMGGMVARDPGHLIGQQDDRLIYTPAPNFFGADTFSYTIEDSFSEQDSATVTVTVHPVNDPPIATSDSYTATQDTILDVPAASGVLANDSDPDSSPGAVLESNTINGNVILNTDGSFTYTPNPGFIGQDIFTYRASDGEYISNEAEVVINVVDAQQPSLTWTSPVSDQDVLHVTRQVVVLEVLASDNQAVDRVQFYRWDADQETYIDLAILTIPPYRFELDTSTVNLGWNQINARAYDNSGNPSEVGYIWLYRVVEIFLPLSLR